jgi:hypothetical protein
MEPLARVDAAAPAADAVEHMEGAGATVILVERDGAPAGWIGGPEIARALEMAEVLGNGSRPAPQPS